ncbi:MAG: ABC transporter ATP-binding protein [Anaerolineaceae bacterium]|nr:ABC transporter ATP-binding protein [Anaerolineaceae bacterium]
MAESVILDVQNLSKSFGSFKVLQSISFQVVAGEILVLRGQNGSGKTTLLNCISGLLPFDEGVIKVRGYDLRTEEQKLRRELVFIPDVPRFYLELTALEHLHFIAAANNALDGFAERAKALMERFGLWNARDVFPHHYSRGMKLKLGLLMGLIRPASLLVFDEPTSAIDSEGVSLIADELRTLKKEGRGILLSTHDGEFADRIADRVLSLHSGRLTE